VIAPHYAEPVNRVMRTEAPLRAEPSAESQLVRSLMSGEPFLLLEESLGWAWGYAGAERRVGYVRSGALAPQRSTEA
jgi:dipeptidyl peptidase-like protein